MTVLPALNAQSSAGNKFLKLLSCPTSGTTSIQQMTYPTASDMPTNCTFPKSFQGSYISYSFSNLILYFPTRPEKLYKDIFYKKKKCRILPEPSEARPVLLPPELLGPNTGLPQGLPALFSVLLENRKSSVRFCWARERILLPGNISLVLSTAKKILWRITKSYLLTISRTGR
jgi:hypothetical protein